MFASFTDATDEVLYNNDRRCLFRSLTIGPDVKEVPEVIPLNRIISLTLYGNASLKTLEYFSALRSLKLIGEVKWISSIIKSIQQINTNLTQLAIITPTVESLSQILTPVSSVRSLHRLEIHTGEYSGTAEICPLPTTISNIQKFVLDSSSTINWNKLPHVLVSLIESRYLSISLIDRHLISLPSWFLHNVRSLSIGLLELPFNCLINLLTATPYLMKLKISGLVDADGFVVNQRWIRTFETAPSLSRICVDLSLERSAESYDYEEIQAPLRALNLSLTCDSDDTEYYSYYGTVNRWWSLKGMIIR